MKLFDVYPLFPIDIVEGKGCKVYDSEGTEYTFSKDTGEFRSFFKATIDTTGSNIAENEVQAIADSTAGLYQDLSKYCQ